MERLNCVVMEDNILEFLDEIEQQLGKGIICCKCKNPCEANSSTRCRISMKNLLTDIRMFKDAYMEINPKKEVEEDVPQETVQQVIEKTIEKQTLID